MKLSLILVFSFLTAKVFANSGLAAKPEETIPHSDAIKNCLVDLYIAQQKFFELNDTYTKSAQDLRLHELKACKGIKISFDIANRETFTLVGQVGSEQWSLDESKSLTQIR